MRLSLERHRNPVLHELFDRSHQLVTGLRILHGEELQRHPSQALLELIVDELVCVVLVVGLAQAPAQAPRRSATR
jgi:hypothetical protein